MPGLESKNNSLKIESRKRQRVALKFRGELQSHPQLSLGFCLFLTWIWTALQNSVISPAPTLVTGRLTAGHLVTGQLTATQPGAASLGANNLGVDTFGVNSLGVDTLGAGTLWEGILGAGSLPFWAIPLLAYAVGFLVLGVLFKARRIVPHGRLYLVSIVACMTLGSLAAVCSNFIEQQYQGMYESILIAFVILIGLGAAGLHVEWGRVLGSRGTQATILHGIVGTLGAAVLNGLLLVLPLAATYLLVVGSPALSLLCLWKSYRANPRLHKYGLESKFSIPWRFILTALVHGFAFSTMWTVLFLFDLGSSYMAIHAAAVAVAALCLFITALLFKMDLNRLIYQVSFPLIALSYLALALFGKAVVFGSMVNFVGCHFLSLLIWTLCVYLVRNRNLSANWVFTCTTGSYMIGQACGVVAGYHTAAGIGTEPNGLLLLSIIMVFVILASSIFMFNNKNLNMGWGMVKPEEEDTRADRVELACGLVKNEFGLTPREEEILVLLARGRNRSAMSKQLFLSVNTVKTHMVSIYQKLNIHSQQELMNLVEKEMEQFSNEENNLPTTAF